MPTVVKPYSREVVGSTDTAAMVSIPCSPVPYKALSQLGMNVRYLLDQFGVSQADLAAAAGIDESTMTKFLQGKREVQLHHLDGMAARFGIDVYQLFQPGISRITERRMVTDRRMGIDRRIQDRLAHVPHKRLPVKKST